MSRSRVHRAPVVGWKFHKSSYPKLRIAPDELVELLGAAGLSVTYHDQEASGMWTTVARSKS